MLNSISDGAGPTLLGMLGVLSFAFFCSFFIFTAAVFDDGVPCRCRRRFSRVTHGWGTARDDLD